MNYNRKLSSVNTHTHTHTQNTNYLKHSNLIVYKQFGARVFVSPLNN